MHEDRSEPADPSSAVSAMCVPHLTLTLARQWGRMQLLCSFATVMLFFHVKGMSFGNVHIPVYFHGYYFVYTMQDFHVWGKNTARSTLAVDRGGAAQLRTGLCFTWGRCPRPMWALVLGSCFVPVVQMKAVGFSENTRSVLLPLSLLQTLLLVALPHGGNRYRNCPLCPVFITEVFLVRIRSRNSSSVRGFAFWWKIITGLQKCPG